MSFKLGCTPAFKVDNIPLFSTGDGKFFVTGHPHPSSATVHLPGVGESYSLNFSKSDNRSFFCGIQVKCEGATMTTAAASPLASSVKKTNGAKLSRLLIDGGTTILRNEFDKHHPPANLAADLKASRSLLEKLKKRGVLNGHQWNKLFPPGGTPPESNTFDITLLFLLLTKMCGLSLSLIHI